MDKTAITAATPATEISEPARQIEPHSPRARSRRAPHFVDLRVDDASDAITELRQGLCSPQAAIAPKFFYDPLGASLFDAITRLPEYYLTRAESALVEVHRDDIGGQIRQDLGCDVPKACTLVDLGAGSCEKAGPWIAALQPAQYVAVDIALQGLHPALARLQCWYPDLDILGVGIDFSRRLWLPDQAGGGPRVVLYPGSSIGNFSPNEAASFLEQVRAICDGGGLLIGVDLAKPVSILEAAYNDALGVTAAFNCNVLLHANRLLGADFDLRDWSHLAFFDQAAGRIEMHLEARRKLRVHWPGGARSFGRGERIHTENSYKWNTGAFADLLSRAGFRRQRHWTDPLRYYGVFWAAN